MRFSSARTYVRTLQECKYTNIPRAFARRDKFMSKRGRKTSAMDAKKKNRMRKRHDKLVQWTKNAALALESISCARVTAGFSLARAIVPHRHVRMHADVCLWQTHGDGKQWPWTRSSTSERTKEWLTSGALQFRPRHCAANCDASSVTPGLRSDLFMNALLDHVLIHIYLAALSTCSPAPGRSSVCN